MSTGIDSELTTVAQILRERVAATHWSASEVARRTGCSRKHLSGLMTGHARLSPTLAYRLELVLGGPGLTSQLLLAQSLHTLALLRANEAAEQDSATA